MSSKWRRREGRQQNLSQQNVVNALRQPGAMLQQIQGTFYSGPIPLPEHLEHYERIQPGLAERITAMAERQYTMAESQTRHRQDIEKMVIKSNVRLSYLGLASGFILGLVGLVSTSYLIYLGRQVGGAAGFIASLATLAGLFLYGKKKQSQDLANKS